MGAAFEPVQLRPLGVGEIFDRAVTLYVRNFSLFAIIAAIIVVPLGVVDYFALVAQRGEFAQILRQLQHPSPKPPVIAPVFSGWFLALGALSVFATPFMYVAMASALGRIYRGERADWRSAYALALHHAAGIVITAIMQIAMLLIAALSGGLVLGLAFAAAILLVQVAAPLGVLMIIVAGILFLAYLVALMLLYLAMALAFDAIAIEQAGWTSAMSSGFSRIFNRTELGKAALVCLAFLAVEVALVVLSAVSSAAIEALLHQPILETLISAVVSLIATGFIGILLAVYYFDVRIRREGLDMQSALEQLQAQT